ncbi:unnamed protein product [[Candida] boidinii]|uniref:Unnamed protein product n=1 Tax=Candida boidinii TaxID=5477 RepID=A0ACB5UBV5_CANBO|nr:unnamed protein product [[Candida] boidinii]
MPSSFSSNSVINGNKGNKSFTFGSNEDDEDDDEDEDDGMMINTRPKLSSVQQNSSSSIPHFHSSRTPSFTNAISQATSTSGTSGDFVTTSTESDRRILLSTLSNSNIHDSINVNESNNINTTTNDDVNSSNTNTEIDQSGC